MASIITSIVTGVLCCLGVISIKIFAIALGLGIAWELISYGLYRKFGFLKIVYHDLLGWHEPDESPNDYDFDGCSFHATCKHCGKDIMQDSQGNWF